MRHAAGAHTKRRATNRRHDDEIRGGGQIDQRGTGTTEMGERFAVMYRRRTKAARRLLQLPALRTANPIFARMRLRRLAAIDNVMKSVDPGTDDRPIATQAIA